MLGIASVYIVTLRSSGSAISRMQAVNLASDIGDRIRANRNAGTAYEGAAAEDGEKCIGADASCTAAEMAAHDLFLWQQQIEATLPGDPTGTVAVDTGTTPATYTITVSWLEAGAAPAEEEDEDENRLSYVMRMQI
jgi:type IV pilus assembly protein PilV